MEDKFVVCCAPLLQDIPNQDLQGVVKNANSCVNMGMYIPRVQG